MKYSIPFSFKGPVSGTKSTEHEGAPIFYAIASTDAMDRDREVMIPKGVMLENFLKNPVMLDIHSYHENPVGKVLEIEVEDEQVGFSFVFAETDEAKELQKLYETGFMNAFSVGFYPHAYKYLDDNTLSTLELPLPDGTNYRFDTAKYGPKSPSAVIYQWELLEISPVPVPANPEALLQRSASQIIRKRFGAQKSALKQIAETQFHHSLEQVSSDISNLLKSLEEGKVSNVIENTSPETLEKEWDALVSQGSVAIRASSNGSGEKDTIDWGKYAEAFAYVDSASANNFSSYEYLHHTVDGDSLPAVFLGVAQAMAKVLASGTLSQEDRKGVYDHLVGHYNACGKSAPEYKETYSEAEIIAISKGEVEKQEETEAHQQEETIEGKEESFDFSEILKESNAFVKSEVDRVLLAFKEFDNVSRIRSAVAVSLLQEFSQLLKELKTSVAELKQSAEEQDNNQEADPSEDDMKEQFADLVKLLDNTLQNHTSLN